jgi:hypothetical protein
MEFSDNAKYWLRKLGNFGVTSSGNEIKGWALLDSEDDYERVYFSAEDLRKLANAANEVADKLDGGLTQRVPDAVYCTGCGDEIIPLCPECSGEE